MKKFYSNYLFILSFLFIFMNCSPKSIDRVLVDQTDISYWDNGQGIGQKTINDITVDIVYSHTDKEYIFFDVAYINHGEEAFLVDPHQVTILDVDRRGQMKGIDPELMILKKELKHSRKEANTKTIALIAGAAIVAGSAVAIANGGGEGESNTSTDNEDPYFYDGIYIANYNQNNGNDYLPDFRSAPLLSFPVSQYPSGKSVEFWQSFSLRKTTIFKNERVRGLIGFSRDDKRNNIRILFNIKGEDTVINFEINRHKP